MKRSILKISAWFALAAFSFSQPAYALPAGYEVIAGEASFEQVGDNMLNITASENSIINYASFNIAENEIVNFFLPAFDAYSLNRILGNGPSQIFGTLNANGNLMLVNTMGIHFGSAADVNVGGLIASAHDISNSNFLAGNFMFAGPEDAMGNSSAFILNEGHIAARDGGFLVLAGDAVENRGTMEAPLGTAALAAGDLITVGISNDGLISIGVDQETARTVLDQNGNPITDQIKNSGTMTAVSGKVSLNAKAIDQIFEKAVNITGLVQADSAVVGKDGVVEMVSSGVNENSGAIRAKTFTESGYTFRNTETGTIDGGLDGQGNIVIGNAYYDNIDGAATISGNIGSNQTDVGDLTVNGNITLTANNLTFTADSDNNGAGAFSMDAATQIDGSGSNYNLTIRTGQNATLRTFVNIGTLTLERAGNASTPTYTANNSISAAGLSVGASTTLNLNNQSLTFASSAAVSNDGTIKLFGSETLTNVTHLDIDSGTVTYTGDSDASGDTYTIKDFGATDYYNLTIASVDSLDIHQLGSALSAAGAFTVSGGTFKSNGQTATITGLTTVSGSGTYDVSASTQTLNGGLTVSGGTYNAGGAGSTDINGDVTISSGTFAAGTGNSILVSGNWSKSGGSFTTTSSTITFDKSSGTQTVNSGGSNFSNLTHSGAGTLQLVTNSLTVAGIVTNSAGTLDLNGQNFGVTSSLSNTATIQAVGNEVITISAGPDWDSGTWKFVGDGDGAADTYTIKEFGTEDYYNLEIAGIDSNDVFQLGASLDLEGTLMVTSGILSLNGNNITDGPSMAYFASRGNIAGTVRLRGNETVFWSANDTDSGTWEYVGDGDSAADSYTIKDFGSTDYFNLRIASTDSGDVYQLGANLVAAGTFTVSAGTYNAYTGGTGYTSNFTGLATISGGNYNFLPSFLQTFDGGLTVSGGTFTGPTGGGQVDVNGDVTISSGTLTNTRGGFFTVSGNWSQTGGTFSHNLQATTFDKATGTQTLNSGGSQMKIVHSGAGTLQLVSSGLTISAGPDGDSALFNNSAGTIDLNGQNLTILGNGPYTMNNDGTMKLRGSETITNLVNDTASGTWEYYGDNDGAADTFTVIDFGGSDYFNLVINSTDTGANKDIFQLGSGLAIDGALTITSGILSMAGNNISDIAGGASATLGNIADTLRLRGSETVFWSTNDTDSGTWEYVGDGDSATDAYTVKDFGATDYYNLVINSTDTVDTFSISAAKTVAGALTVTQGTFDLNGFSNQITGLATVNGGTLSSAAEAQTYNGGLTISSGTYSAPGAAGDIDVNGDFTLSGGTYSAPMLTYVSGNFLRSAGTFTHNNGTFNFDKGTGTQTVNSGGSNFYNVTHSGAGTLQLSAAFYQNGNAFTNSAGVFDLNGYDWVASTQVATISNTATIRQKGNETVYTAFTSPDLDSGTWEYVGDGDGAADTYTLTRWGSDYFNLTINSTDANDVFRLAGGNYEMNGAFTLTSGIFYLNGFDLQDSAGGATASLNNIAGTFRLRGNESVFWTSNDTNSGTWEYVGDGDGALDPYTIKDFGGTDYYNLVIASTDSADTYSMPNAKSIAGAFTISSGGVTASTTTTVTGLATISGGSIGGFAAAAAQTFNGGLTVSGGTFTGSGGTIDVNGNLTISSGTFTAPGVVGGTSVSGNFSHSGGTFNHGSGTVTLDGTNQTISGSTTFYNLTKVDGSNNSTDLTLTFDNTATQTIASGGTLTITGIDTDDRVNLVSDSPGTRWELTCSSCTTSINWADVTDSDASGGSAITHSNTISGGHNLNWGFGVTTTWTGATSVWSSSGNWSNGTPGIDDTAIIADVATDPVLDTNVSITSLTINTGGLLTLSGFNLTISDTFSNDGTVRLKGSETLSLTQDTNSGTWEYVGDADLALDTFTIKDFGAGTDYYNLLINGTDSQDIFQSASAKSVGGALTVTSGTYDANGGNTTVTGAAQVNNGAGTYLAGSGTQTLNGGLTVSGGNFTGASNGTIDVNGDVLISGGTLTGSGTTGSFTVSGDWSRTSGTFSDNTGTVTFDKGTGTQTLNASTSSFYSISHSGAGTLQLISSGVTLGGNLTNSAGIFDLNGQALTVTGLENNTATVRLRGSESVSITTHDTDSGTWEYIGDNDGAADTFTIKDFGMADYFNLVINSSDTGANKDIFQLGSALAIDGALTITSGILSMNGNDISDIGGGAAATLSNIADTLRLRGSETVFWSTNDTNSGTWEYRSDGDSALDTFTIKDFGATDYYNLIINSTDAADIFQLGGALSVAGAYTLSSGVFNGNGQTVTATGLATVSGGTYQANSMAETFNGGLTVSGGSYSGSTAGIDINGDLTVSSGTFDAPNANVNLSGNMNLTGSGTFNANSGTFIFDGTTSLTSNGKTFNHFTVGTNTASGSVTLADSLDINGTLSFETTGGTTTLNSSNRTVNYSGATLDLNAADTFTATGSTWIFDGTTALSSAGKTFNNITIGTNTASGSLTFSDAADIDGALSFNTTGGTAALNATNRTVNYAGSTLDLTNADTFTTTGSTFVFDGTTTLTSAGKTFNNVTVGTNAASGSLTLGDTADINGTLAFNTTGGTAALVSSNRTVNYAGSTLDLTNADTFTATGSTWIFDGTTTLTSAGKTFNNVTVGTNAASGSVTLADTTDIDGSLAFNTTGGTAALDATNRTVNFSGSSMDLTNADTFTATGSTWIFDGTTTLTSAGKTFNNVTIGTNGASGSLTLGDAADINGTLAFNTTGGTAALDSSSRTVNYAGATLNLTNADTFTSTGSTWIFDGTTTLTSAGKSFNNMTIGTNAASGSLTLGDTADINGNLSFNTTGGTAALDSSNRTVNYAGSALNLTNADTFTTTGSTFIFDGTTSLTSAGKAFNNVTIGTNTASGGLTLSDTTDINGTLAFNTTGGTASLDISNIALNYAGTSLDLTNLDTLTSTGSTWTLDAAADQAITAAGKSFNHFTVNNTGAAGSDDITFTGNLDVDGIFTLTDGNFHAPASMTVGDDFLFTGGTFDHNNGIVTLDTTATSTVNVNGAGAGSLSFFDFSIIGGGKTVNFGTGDTFNILSANTWTVTGAAGNLVTLDSTGGGQWNVNPAGSNLTNASIANANNTSGVTVTCVGCTNGGNNTGGWNFPVSGGGNTPGSTPVREEETTRILEIVDVYVPSGTEGPVIILIPESGEPVVVSPVTSTPPTVEEGPKDSGNNPGPGGDPEGGSGGPGGGGPGKKTDFQESDETWDLFNQVDRTKYKTVVLVYEGKVFVQNFDAKGKTQGSGVYVKPNMKTEAEWDKNKESVLKEPEVADVSSGCVNGEGEKCKKEHSYKK